MMNGKYNHANVIRWSKRLNASDLFDLDKLFIPINIPGRHWFLIIVDFEQSEIVVCDSDPAKTSRLQYVYNVQQYLNDEWKENMQEDLERRLAQNGEFPTLMSLGMKCRKMVLIVGFLSACLCILVQWAGLCYWSNSH